MDSMLCPSPSEERRPVRPGANTKPPPGRSSASLNAPYFATTIFGAEDSAEPSVAAAVEFCPSLIVFLGSRAYTIGC